jgi:hypothetical protein
MIGLLFIKESLRRTHSRLRAGSANFVVIRVALMQELPTAGRDLTENLPKSVLGFFAVPLTLGETSRIQPRLDKASCQCNGSLMRVGAGDVADWVVCASRS